MSGLEEGAMVAVGEKSPQRAGARERKNLSHKKVKPSTAFERRNGDTPIGYLGQTSLMREQCGEYE
jgi:hypothetical protein